MACCHCQGADKFFGAKIVARDIRRYRKKGPSKATRMLIAELRASNVAGRTLLDIGGGIGMITHELFEVGIRQAIHVDASSKYIAAARAEAQRRGHADHVEFQHGDFVELSDNIPPVDIVTLDSVICCYPDWRALVSFSASHAKESYGVIFPRDVWWMKLGFIVQNLFLRLTRSTFRIFVHPVTMIEEAITRSGLQLRAGYQTLGWHVRVYARQSNDSKA